MAAENVFGAVDTKQVGFDHKNAAGENAAQRHSWMVQRKLPGLLLKLR